MKKWKCSRWRCGWHGDEAAILTAPDPFGDEGDTLTACPACREVEVLTAGCDEPGCTEAASCGWPSDAGYRNTCGAHAAFWRTPPAPEGE